ncbi:Na+-dependent transporters of the SNF family protein [Anaerohalosphaera lusitana]|uniref:Na+-dependent transporters of the SNF family protein n=1 Tax=Anaerohalosphaera lusitana TaxID=1936003 RepID=A0A1U9NNG0_9BACT|nr:sodium-dependent transporter [Anaerohalosphaera lusitana]AQT69327.1 Na+-dependent transporters of the SNF family protein [Anaerohalosphaera lusitana]
MPELLEEQRETWGTRGGFILAAIGSAVGLGNLWAFPYKLYAHGGGAFLIPYILAMFCIGLPLLILEFSLGHFTQRAAPDAFRRCNKKLEFVGWWAIILGFVIVIYYPTILAYCFSFMWYSLQSIFTGQPLPWAGEGVEGVAQAKTFFFDTYLSHQTGTSLGSIQWHIVGPLLLAWTAMYLCIFKGVNLVGKIVWLTVPLPFLMLVVLTVRGLTLEGSMKGLVYYLDPVWSELAKPTTWRFAFGQVFFSLSLAFGVMITYSSFLHRKSDINNNAAIITLSDFGTSFVGGIAIFATLGGMAFATAQAGDPVAVDNLVDKGPGLAFVAFPYALAQLPGAAWWSLIFFLTLVTLGIDSAFSITESVLAGIVDKTGWKRSTVLPIMSAIGLVFGLIFVTNGGLNWLGAVDGFVNGTWGIAFLGLLEALVLGWLYKIENLRTHANERSDWYLGRWWNHSIRIVIPLILGTLFFWSLNDDLTAGGFVKTAEGAPNWPNIFGLALIITAPILAVVMSSIKTKDGSRKGFRPQQVEFKYPPTRSGKLAGLASFALVAASAVIAYFSLRSRGLAAMGIEQRLLTPFVLAAAVVAVTTWVMIKNDNNYETPSRFVRLAGIIATLELSAYIAAVLIHHTSDAKTAHVIRPDHDTLTNTSYVILSAAILIIVTGLGWCFYKAITVNTDENETSTE